MNQAFLSVDRARLRYRMDRSSLVHRPRLDQAFSRVLEGLEFALRERGVDPERPLCIRRLQSHVRLSLQDADGPLTEAWLNQLAGTLSEAIASGSADVIRYRTRRQALSELVLAAADGDTRHAWAWAQLGLWSRGDSADAAVACEEALRALGSDPPAVVPVLAYAARAGRLERLLVLGCDATWSAVARAALEAAGIRELPSARRVLDGQTVSAPAESDPSAPAPARLEMRALSLERWARLFARSGIAAAAQRLTTPLSRAKLEACALLAGLEAEPVGLPPLGPAWFEAASEALIGAPAAPAAERASSGRSQLLRAPAASPPAPDVPKSAPASVEAKPAVTSAGGLLFLLHLARDLDLPRLIAQDPVLSDRSLREVLVRLAARWAAIELRDPAALAFAGLGPEARLDFELGPWLAAEAAFDRLRSSFTVALAERLPPAQDSSEQLRWVVERRAVIVADPGWIEAQFSLADVSVPLRRSGLDLHPNFLPWLGVVLRFSYV